MSSYTVRILDSLPALAAYAPRWDDLWRRADVAFPTLRAEFLAQWIEQFAPRSTIRLMVVEEGDTAVAALPLVGRRFKRMIPAGGLPSNGWTAAGELLMDCKGDTAAVGELLAGALRQLPWPFLCLQPVHYQAPRWQALLTALSALGMSSQTRPIYTIGAVRFPGDWETYQASWSKKHRRNMQRDLRRLHAAGPTEFEDHLAPAVAEVSGLMRAGFEIEDRSWKGAAGTSVLRGEQLAEFYIRQAEAMAGLGCLRIHFLRHAGRRIAFQYGWFAKQTYFSPKIAYDPDFAHFSPGQLLTGHVLRLCCDSQPQPVYDFHGDATAAVARWTNASYPVGGVIIPLKPVVGGAILRAYQWSSRSGIPA
ncbi:MAG: GNAT family N-acetyltransferase [Pirellulales bacterium]